MSSDNPDVESHETHEMTPTFEPFPASYVDRFMDAIEGWRTPYFLVYSLLFSLQVLIKQFRQKMKAGMESD